MMTSAVAQRATVTRPLPRRFLWRAARGADLVGRAADLVGRAADLVVRAPDLVVRPTCGAREEDDAIRGDGDVLERGHHLRLAPPGLGRQRHRRPHPAIELAAELLDQALCVLGDLRVALGDELLTVARAHAEELHTRRLCQRA